MQDETTGQKSDDDSPGGSGSRLRTAREAAGISIDEVADKLHLDRSVVLALEEGDYEVLGAPVFVKGHLRSYARLLSLPEDELANDYQIVEPEAEEFKTLSAQTVVKAGANLSNFFLWVLLTIIVLIGAIYFLLGDEEAPASDFVAPALATESLSLADEDIEPLENVADKPNPIPEQTLAQVEEPASAATWTAGNEIRVEPVPFTQSVSDVTEPMAPEPEPESLLLSLSLRFTGECWVEISDSRRRLLYGLEKAGSERVLKGVPPFRLFLGNAEAVELRVADQEYIVPSSVRSGSNTARFVIDNNVIAGILNQ